jgi:hypothetical protein
MSHGSANSGVGQSAGPGTPPKLAMLRRNGALAICSRRSMSVWRLCDLRPYRPEPQSTDQMAQSFAAQCNLVDRVTAATRHPTSCRRQERHHLLSIRQRTATAGRAAACHAVMAGIGCGRCCGDLISTDWFGVGKLFRKFRNPEESLRSGNESECQSPAGRLVAQDRAGESPT